MTENALPCIACGRTLPNIDGPNQPAGGIEFTTHGHYGTRIFDPMDGSSLAINVCDDCLAKNAAEKCVLRYPPRSAKPAFWEPHHD